MWSKLTILATLLISAAGAQKAQPLPQVPADTIVFVCEHGSAKSVVAAAHFNRLAAENHLPYRAVARGLTPDPAIPVPIQSGLLADGLDPSAWKPQPLTKLEIRSATRVVSLGADLPQPVPGSKLLKWNDIPSLNENYSSARSVITLHLEELIASLSPTRKR